MSPRESGSGLRAGDYGVLDVHMKGELLYIVDYRERQYNTAHLVYVCWWLMIFGFESETYWPLNS
jgi:hypothetical protein